MSISPLWLEHPFFLRIERSSDLDLDGRVSFRRAARAIAINEGKLLMVYSPVNGDYKFPGGGVMENEPMIQALQRELREETGFSLSGSVRLAGVALEYDHTADPDCDVFKMFSDYFLCTIADGPTSPRLDPYEAELGFSPTWVACGDALKNNQALIDAGNANHIGWLMRETEVLRILHALMAKKSK